MTRRRTITSKICGLHIDGAHLGQDAGRMTGDAALIPGNVLRNPADHDETACPEGSLRRSSGQSQLRADGHEGVSSEICQLMAVQR